jgi:hypothetical protein
MSRAFCFFAVVSAFFVSQATSVATLPGKRPLFLPVDLHAYATPRHLPECLPDCFRCRRYFLLQENFAVLIQCYLNTSTLAYGSAD